MVERDPVITEVLGVDYPEDRRGSARQAIATLTGSSISLEEYVASFHHTPHRHQTQLQRERVIDFESICELLRNTGDDLIDNTSTLTDWAAYCRLMRDYGTRGDGNASALLIGAYSAISARSFECLAKAEYGAGRVVVLDMVAGADKMKHGNFVFGNGTELPFADGSFDFVHTNRLTHMLQDPGASKRSGRDSRAALLAEIARVTAPGGQVFMQ
jgi:SAM-dependent methyltransferase